MLAYQNTEWIRAQYGLVVTTICGRSDLRRVYPCHHAQGAEQQQVQEAGKRDILRHDVAGYSVSMVTWLESPPCSK